MASNLQPHWDGKRVLALRGKANVERLPVLVSAGNEFQILGVPQLESATGLSQADAIVELVKQWNLVDRIIGLNFDTCSVNTGRIQETCVRLEQRFGKNLLYFACRAPHLRNSFTKLCLFVIKIYIQYWFEAPLPIAAPLNDLTLIKDLINYKSVNKKISEIASGKIKAHLWYLSEELVAMAFFDSRIPNETKRKMIMAMKTISDADDPPKRLMEQSLEKISKYEINEFVSSNTKRFFEITNLSTQFLDTDPKLWDSNSDYIEALKIVSKFNVVNDAAERAVALMQRYNRTLTKEESQLQELYLSVQDHIRQFPNCNKYNF